MRSRLLPIVILLTGVHAFAEPPAVAREKSGDIIVAATVPTSVSLLHTAQMLSPEDDPRLSLLAAKEIVKANGGDPKQIVKINVVASTPEIAERARELFATEPAPVSYVVGALPHGKKVGIDVVAVDGSSAMPSSATPTSAARVLPAGPRVYVSGQAEKGATPAEAAAKTLQSLLKTLESVGSSKADVVQVKCFLTPMSAAPEVIQEIERTCSSPLPALSPYRPLV